MKKLCCLLFVCLLCAFSSVAQTIYKGKVVDEKTVPVVFANVMLISRQDSSFMAGTTTDKEGSYLLEAPVCTDCLLRVSAIGYETVYSQDKTGNILLPSAAYSLEEVSVSGKRPVYRMKGTGFVMDVSNSLLQNIGTANDVLKQMPGVIAKNDSYEVFGKGAATIFINGRQVRDPSELERLSSEDIVSVELVNNPGTQYEADMRSVLRIRTRRKGEGWASRLRLQGTQNHRFSDLEQLNLSYSATKVSWYANLYHNGTRSQVDGRNEQTIYTDNGIYKLESEMMDWDQRAERATLETGASLFLYPKQEIGLSYIYDYSKNLYEGDNFERMSSAGSVINRLSNYSYSNKKFNQHAVNLYYQGSVGERLGVKLNADYIHRNTDVHDWVTESGMYTERKVTSLSDYLYNLYAVQLVLSHPVGTGSLEVGVDFSYMDNDQTYRNLENYLPDGLFLSEETKIAGFANYSGSIGRLGWSAGVRYEQFRADYYENGDPVPTVKQTYKELYPMLTLSLPVKEASLSLSYSKRTARPTFYQLRNGIEYSDQYGYAIGNPYLQSSQLHDLSLNAGYRFLYLSLGYNYTKDRMIVNDRIEEGDPFVLVSSHENAEKYQGVNAMLTFQHKIGLWSPTWTAAVFKDYLDLYDYQGNPVDLGNPYGYFAANNMFALPGGFVLNVDGTYMTAGDMAEIHMKPVATLDLGLRKTVLKGKLDLNLQFTDVFASSKQRIVIYTPHRTFYRWNYNDSRKAILTVVYNFNTYKKKYKGKNSAQSEVRRM